MKKLIIYTFLALGAVSFVSCGGGQKKNAGSTAGQKPVFPAVEMPVTITDPQGMANYMTQHFWDKFDFTDTSFLSHPDILEQQLVDYAVILPYAGENLASQSLSKLMQRAQGDTAMYRFFIEKTEHYLWDPNSPYRNDEFYIPVLETMLASDGIDEATRARSEYRLELARKNRPGTVANDFTYTLNSGQSGRMSRINSAYLLLFFNNPGCTACAEIIASTQNSPLMNRLLEDKKLAILAVYPDEDLAEWRDYVSKMPANWINAYDREGNIKSENLYDLKAIPTLYLLDKDKRVILKDVYIEQVEEYLQRQDQP